MILNLSKIKTESLLLFCRDLILSYKDKDDVSQYNIDKNIIKKFDDISDEMLENILRVTFKNEYYISNKNHYRIKAILDGYNFINKQIEKALKKDETFNPSMLYFSLLALWFKELNKESKNKEYIYFILYPYAKRYDELFLDIEDKEFKTLNFKMLDLAEGIISKLDAYSFR